MDKDVRWVQRFSNYQKALNQLNDGVNLAKTRELNKLEKQGLIQAFEYTHELAWKTMKDFIISRGSLEIFGSKDSTREAFRLGIIDNGDVWMSMIQSRNLTSHTYDEATTEKIVRLVIDEYLPEFLKLNGRLSELKQKEAGL